MADCIHCISPGVQKYFLAVLIADLHIGAINGIAPPTVAHNPSSVGVPNLHSLSQRNFPVSIAPCPAQSHILVPSPAPFPASPIIPPGVAIERPSPVPNFPPLYPRLSVSAPKDSAPDFCCRAVSSLNICPSPHLFFHVNIPPNETSSEKGAERKSPTIPSVPPTACDAPEAIPAETFCKP